MGRVVKINNKKYYKVKADETKYLLFKSKDDFKKTEELEKMVFDLTRFAIDGKDGKKAILNRMKSIEEYFKTLGSSKIKILIYDKKFGYNSDEPIPNNHKDAFYIKFSNLVYYIFVVHIYPIPCPISCSGWNYSLFYEKMETEEMKEKFRNLSALIGEAILIVYK